MIPTNQLFFNGKNIVYDVDAQIYFDQVVTNGGAPLTAAWKRKLNTWFVASKSNGYFSELDRLHSLYNQHEIAARTSLVNPGQAMCTFTGSPTFTPFYGVATNGTSSYIRTGFIPSTSGVAYTLNSVFAGFGNLSNTSGTSIEFGCNDGTNILEIATCYSGVYYSDANDAGPNNTQANVANLSGDYIVKRTASNILEAYKNNTVNTTAAVSTARPTIQAYLGAFNETGTANYFKADEYTWFGFGSKNIDVAIFRTDINILIRNIDRSIILIIDQSNSTGQAGGHLYANLSAQYKPTIINGRSVFDGTGMYQYIAGDNSIHDAIAGTSFEWTASCVYDLVYTYNKRPFIVNTSIGNTSLYSPAIGTGTWNPDAVGNLYTTAMNTYFYPALTYVQGNVDVICVLGLVENDSVSLASANAHYANKKAMIAKLRDTTGNGGTGISDLKIILMKPKIELDPATHPYTQIVIDAVDQILSEDPLTYEFDEAPLSYQGDLIHWTDASTMTAGSLLATKINTITQY